MRKEKKYAKKYFMLIWSLGKYGIFVSTVFMVIKSFFNILLPRLLQNIIDVGIVDREIGMIIQQSMMYIVIVILIGLLNLIITNYHSILAQKVSSTIKLNFVEHLSKANGKSISQQRSGDIIRILDNDLFQLESFGINMILELILKIIVAVVAFFSMLKIDITLMVTIISLQILMFTIQYLFSKWVTSSIRKVRETAGEQTVLEEQFVSNLRNVILSNIEHYFLKLFWDYQSKLVKQNRKVNFLISCHTNISIIFTSFSTILTYLVGGVLIVQEQITMGQLIAFSQYTVLLIAPLNYFLSYNIKYKQSMIALEKIYDEMQRIAEIKESDKKADIAETVFSLAFHHVSFTYQDKLVLQDFDYNFRKGQITVITGQSGAGKSTLLNLIYRLWEPQQGIITINGEDLKTFSLKSIKEKICIICQEGLIVNKSIMENVLLDNKGITDEWICRTFRAVEMDQILSEEMDVNTALGERGGLLSGGQKQRIGLARALLRNSDVLILDESTSSLDNMSQQKLMENMMPYFQNKIVIIIAHRLSIAQKADCIIVMEHGKIVEKGTYQELTHKKGFFHNLNKAGT